MSLNTGLAALEEARQRLRVRRGQLESDWDDEVARTFAAAHLDVLDRDLKRAIDTLQDLMPVIQKIRHDCE